MNNKEILVDKEIRLFEFLRLELKHLSKNNVKSLLVKKMVFVNDAPISQYDYSLKPKDLVKIGYYDVNERIKIVFEDKYLIVVSKPNNLLSIATDKEKDKTLYKMVMNYLKGINKNNRVFIVHRLDKDTSGLVVFAKTEEVKMILQDNWDNAVRKYIAKVHGVTKEKEVLVNYLEEDKLFVRVSKKGREAITEYTKINNNDNYSLLDINIKTGFKNQIRVQLNNIKHPIVGDVKYGIKDQSKRLMLHAYYLRITHPITKKVLSFEDDIPNVFKI